jgi:hypothetical protein
LGEEMGDLVKRFEGGRDVVLEPLTPLADAEAMAPETEGLLGAFATADSAPAAHARSMSRAIMVGITSPVKPCFISGCFEDEDDDADQDEDAFLPRRPAG